MSLSNNYPDIRPVWMNDYANAGVIDPRCSFARSDSTPSNVHYWSDEDHLSSENLLLQSSDFDTTWVAQGLSGTPTSGQADPAGTSNGFTLGESSTSNAHRVTQQVTASGDLAYTVYAKQNSGTRYLLMKLFNTEFNWEVAVFDLAGGAASTSSGSSSTFTSVTTSQTASGNGYYKCVIKATGTANSVSVALKDANNASGLASNYGSRTYTGDGTSSIKVAFASLSSVGGTDYQPTTTQIHREYAATLKSVAYSGQPRFEYEPTGDRSAKGLLIESSSTTKTTYSEQMFTDYVKNRSTITTNSAIAPSGELTANLWTVDGTASNSHNLGFDFATGGTATHTYSVFAKAGNVNYLIMRWSPANGAFNDGYVSFNLANGTIGTTTGTVSSSSIQDCSNGWYRCSITTTALASTTGRVVLYIAQADNTLSFDGNSYDHLLVWGAQIEEANFPSSYIKSNSGSASTRTADSLSVATADIGYTGGPVSIVAEVGGGYGASAIADLRNSSGSSDNYLLIWKASASAVDSSAFAVYSKADGTLQTSQNITGSGGETKLAVRMDTNNIASCADGGAVTADTTAVIPDGLNKLWIGGSAGGSGYELNSNLKRIAFYPEALSDTELQALTS